MRLYRIRAYSAARWSCSALVPLCSRALILLPLYFQLARGQDAIHTGLLLIPQGSVPPLACTVPARPPAGSVPV